SRPKQSPGEANGVEVEIVGDARLTVVGHSLPHLLRPAGEHSHALSFHFQQYPIHVWPFPEVHRSGLPDCIPRLALYLLRRLRISAAQQRRRGRCCRRGDRSVENGSRLAAASSVVPQEADRRGDDHGDADGQDVERGLGRSGESHVRVAVDRVYVVLRGEPDQHQVDDERAGDDGSQPDPAVGAQRRGDGGIGAVLTEPEGLDLARGFVLRFHFLVSGDESFDPQLRAGEV
ncbi:unnamed protein product, partial [Linum tenue]